MSDHAHPERQRFLRPEREVHLTVREFYGWLFMAATYGLLTGIVIGGLTGWSI